MKQEKPGFQVTINDAAETKFVCEDPPARPGKKEPPAPGEEVSQ